LAAMLVDLFLVLIMGFAPLVEPVYIKMGIMAKVV
jgi:hypothetical protein